MTDTTKADLFSQEMEIRQAASGLPMDPGLDFRPFFGGLGGWASGHFFAFYSGRDHGLYLKLSLEDQAELLAAAGLKMSRQHELGKHYLLVPPGVMNNPAALSEWVERSVLFALSLPLPKQKRGG